MNVVYLTTAWRKDDYHLALGEGRKVPNPAGQNFHRRFYEGLSSVEGTQVFAYCFVKQAYAFLKEESYQEGSLSFTYIRQDGGFFARLSQGKKIARRIAEELKLDSATIVYDTLSLTMSTAAKELSKLTGWKRIAICTDNPHNITGSSSLVNSKLLSISSDADGYFALTQGLSDLFNKKNKPVFFDLGIVEPFDMLLAPVKRPYLYYGGTLFESYGVNELVRVFTELDPNFDLILAGHEANPTLEKECEKSAKVHLLGLLSAKENILYESCALACINPKPYDERIDCYAVPSKMLEYLRYGKCIISTYCEPVKNRFPNCINWMEEESLEQFLLKHLDKEKNLVGLIPNQGSEQEIADELNQEKVASRFVLFLQSNGLL